MAMQWLQKPSIHTHKSARTGIYGNHICTCRNNRATYPLTDRDMGTYVLLDKRTWILEAESYLLDFFGLNSKIWEFDKILKKVETHKIWGSKRSKNHKTFFESNMTRYCTHIRTWVNNDSRWLQGKRKKQIYDDNIAYEYLYLAFFGKYLIP